MKLKPLLQISIMLAVVASAFFILVNISHKQLQQNEASVAVNAEFLSPASNTEYIFFESVSKYLFISLKP